MTTIKTTDFEGTLKELNDIVLQMEKGELSLEQSLKKFERGIALIQHCQKTLEKAQQKVAILSEPSKNAGEGLSTFEDES